MRQVPTTVNDHSFNQSSNFYTLRNLTLDTTRDKKLFLYSWNELCNPVDSWNSQMSYTVWTLNSKRNFDGSKNCRFIFVQAERNDYWTSHTPMVSLCESSLVTPSWRIILNFKTTKNSLHIQKRTWRASRNLRNSGKTIFCSKKSSLNVHSSKKCKTARPELWNCRYNSFDELSRLVKISRSLVSYSYGSSDQKLSDLLLLSDVSNA